jgi:general secretion pathway protein G
MTDFYTSASSSYSSPALFTHTREMPSREMPSREMPSRKMRRNVRRHTRGSAGFTLIEIMAVVVIMGMLMATLAVGISGQLDRATIANTKTQINRIEQALEFYKLDNKRFPNADQGLDALLRQPTAPPVPRSYNPAGYIKREALLDAWDMPFQYQIPGSHNPYTFDIWSYGPDGVEGGDDIKNWSDEGDA